MKRANTVRIKKSAVFATVKYFGTLVKIPIEHLHVIGSAGQTPYSGDIDIAIDVNKFNPTKIHHHLLKFTNGKGIYNKAFNVYSYPIPIRGDKKNGKVQIDLMFTPIVEWAKFSYYSEGNRSKYKGAIRNILLSAIIATVEDTDSGYLEYDNNDNLLIRVGRIFDLNYGLRQVFQYRPTHKKSGEYLKTIKSCTFNEFQERFPHINIKEVTPITDPELAVQLMFNSHTKSSDVKTTEQVLQLIHSSFDNARKNRIFEIAAKRVKSINSKVQLPVEILERL